MNLHLLNGILCGDDTLCGGDDVHGVICDDENDGDELYDGENGDGELCDGVSGDGELCDNENGDDGLYGGDSDGGASCGNAHYGEICCYHCRRIMVNLWSRPPWPSASAAPETQGMG